MGFESGNLTFQRFAVIGDAPTTVDQELLDKLAGQAFKPSEIGVPEAEKWGWSGAGHIDDRQFTFENCAFADCLLFALRIDTNKVPAVVVTAITKTEEAAVAAGNPSGFISKGQKRDVKDAVRRQCEDQLRQGKHRRSKLVPVLWDLQAGILYGPTSVGVVEKLGEIFERTFGLSLEWMTAARQALVWAEKHGNRRAFEDARATPFTPPPAGGEMWPEYAWCSKGDPKNFLGNEWLMALWQQLESGGGSIDTAAGSVAAVITGGLRLECAFSCGGRDTLNGTIDTMPEAREALRSGKVPREVGLILELGWSFQFRVRAETLSVGGLVLPEVEEAETPRQKLEERIGYLRQFSKALDGVYETFIKVRLGAGWAASTKKIAKWIAGDEPRFTKAAAPQTGDEQLDQLTNLAMTIAKNPKAADATMRMMDLRDKFKRFAGAEYANLVRIASDEIRKAAGDGNVLSTAISMATAALKEKGDYRKMQCYIAAAVEMTEQPVVPITKPLAKAMKQLVSGIGKKDGFTSMTIESGGEKVTIDEAGAARIRKNADAMIAGRRKSR